MPKVVLDTGNTVVCQSARDRKTKTGEKKVQLIKGKEFLKSRQKDYRNRKLGQRT